MLMTRSIAAIDVTPSGSVAAIDQRGEVHLWSGGRQVASWRADPSGYQIAWLDDGHHVMTRGTSGLQSWTATGQPAGHRVASKRGHEVLGFELSRDRKTIAIRMQGSGTFVDVADLTAPAMAGVRVSVMSQSETRLSDDGTSLLIVERYRSGGEGAAAIKIHHIATGINTTDVGVGIDPAAVALSRFEDRVAIGKQRYAGHHIALVRASDGMIERTLEDEGGTPWRVEFSPDGTKLWSSGADGHGRIWDVATGARVNAVPGASGGVWAPSGDALFVVERGGKEVRRVSLAAPPPTRAAVLRRPAVR